MTTSTTEKAAAKKAPAKAAASKAPAKKPAPAKTTTKTAKAPASKTAPAATAPVDDISGLQLMEVDPRTLVIGRNVRTITVNDLDPEFVASIRVNGVLAPVRVYHGPDGQLTVDDGQCRTIAAIHTDRPTVPAVLIPAPDDATLIAQQITLNDHRHGLRDQERAAGFAQLALLGVTAGDIARRTGHKVERVDRALRLSASQRAKELAAQYPTLSFDDLVTFAEFDDDPDAQEQLAKQVEHGWSLKHRAQQLRDSRAERAIIRAKEEELRAAGVTVLAEHPRGLARDLNAVKSTTNDTGPMTIEEHRGCEGHAVYVEVEDLYPGDEGHPDPAPEPGDDGEDEDGEEVKPLTVATVNGVCLDPARYGHTPRYGTSWGGAAATAGAKSEAEKEKETAERRRVIAGNKLWRAATEVRRAFLTELAQRKEAPKGTGAFLALALARKDHPVGWMTTHANTFGRSLFGLDKPVNSWENAKAYQRQQQELPDLISKATDGRAMLIGLVLLLAAYEENLTAMAWRPENSGNVTTIGYLRFLQGAGYELSDIERLACGETVKLPED